MSINWTLELTRKFVQEYEREECLWNPDHEDYRQRSSRDCACARIAEAMQITGLDMKAVKRKIKDVRDIYFSEIIKMEKSNTGIGTPYRSTVPWLDAAEFLSTVRRRRGSQSNPVSSNFHFVLVYFFSASVV